MQPRTLVIGLIGVAVVASGAASGLRAAAPNGTTACTTLRGSAGPEPASLACLSAAVPIPSAPIGNLGAAGRPGTPTPGARVWTWTVPLPATSNGLVSSAVMTFSDATLIPLAARASIDLAGCQSMDVFVAPTPYETPYSGLLAGWYAGKDYREAPPSVSGTVSGLSGQIRVAIDCSTRDRTAGGSTPAGMLTLTFAEKPGGTSTL